ncbi:MAG: M48 family metallopeptidase [Rhodocyclaceae bacterium]|nr:M48 family metallopeptidase [Rhodocyclaceae bacterium]
MDDTGIVVRAPQRMPRHQIDAFVDAHGAWIERQVQRRRERRLSSLRTLVRGLSLSVLGRPVMLDIQDGVRRPRWRGDAAGGDVLVLPDADPVRALETALRARALTWFEGRVAEHCHVLGVAVPVVRVGAARTRWGSCSQRSGIRLHWKLALLAPELADYVVAHEVAHLREMNHSERFWSHVSTLCPDWPALRKRLRREGEHVPTFLPPGGGDC